MSGSSRTAVKAAADIPLDLLRQHPGNPRKMTKVRLEQLQRTLTAEREMLAARPLIALPDGTVIAGNQRLAAARELGWETIPVVYADLDQETAERWIAQQLVNSTTLGDAVLDPFGGSGSTMIACETLGRRALLMEIDPAYVDVIRQRYADYTNQPHLAP